MAAWFCRCGAENDIGEKVCLFCGASSDRALSASAVATLKEARARNIARKQPLSINARWRKQFWPPSARGLGVAGVLILVVAAWYIVPFLRKLPFSGYIPTYVMVAESAGTPESPYVRGKVIPIDVVGKQVDDLWFKIPDALRASNPQDVGTVLLINCTSEIAGYYFPEDAKPSSSNTSNTIGRRWMCATDLVDEGSHHVLDVQHFTGVEPPNSIDGNQLFDVSGPKPYGQMIFYLTGLPRR